MIQLEEAQEFVLAAVAPLEPEEVVLEEALGCVAATAVVAREPSPRFANSSMDGFAVRSSDTSSGSVRLRIVASIFAGDMAAAQLSEGEAMRIMTGAPVPKGADSVCMREEATVDDHTQTVLLHRTVNAGEFVRRVGDDVAEGQTLLDPGDEVGPALIGVLASQGYEAVFAHPRPRVGVLSTGNELTDAPEAPAEGKIRDSNRPSLLASLRQSGFEAVDLGIVGDTMEEITKGFERGIFECDAVVSTGGVSVGDADFVKSVIGELSQGSARSMQVAIKPGKPFAFGVTPEGAPLFGLAGNPVSTLVGFELFVRPALRRLAGHHQLKRPTLSMVLDCPLPRSKDRKVHLVHAVCQIHDDGRFHVESVARTASHLLHAIARSNALAIVPDGDGLGAGDEVFAMILEADQTFDRSTHYLDG